MDNAEEFGPLDIALDVTRGDGCKAADAFWEYWRENGETHRHGYYESTWGAINAALRVAGVIPHKHREPRMPTEEEIAEQAAWLKSIMERPQPGPEITSAQSSSFGGASPPPAPTPATPPTEP